jgi:hypothetical protein
LGNRHPDPTMTGFEPLIGAAAAGLGGLITSLVKDKGTETLKNLDWDIGKNLAVRKATVDYVRRYIDRHGTLKVACVRMDYPVRLDEIYTAVQLLDRSALRYFESEDALQEQYRESGKRNFSVTNAEKKPGLQVANEQQYLMVLGGPGVGKSTFLRKVGLEALRTLGRRDFAGKDPGNLLVPQETFYQHPCIPVMLELRQFDKLDTSIQSFISEELETCGFPHPEELTELFLKNGKLLVLLDGMDEVPTANLDHAIKEIKKLVDNYSKIENPTEKNRRAKKILDNPDTNRFIASCRIAAYTFGGFTRFKDVAMAAFEDEQIEQFIKNWFQKDRDLEVNTADRCWELLNSNDYRAAKELAQTPLLLTLLCVVYDEFQDFPKKRHALYSEALDVLLRKWASEKRIQRNPIYQELSAELELDMLAEIAYASFVDNQLFFSKKILVEQIRGFLVDNLNAPNHLDAETVLREIEIQQGILVERARDAYSFSHLTFQEYLTAKCIVDNRKVNQLVRSHVNHKRWREVFLSVAGLASGRRGADDMLLAMERQAQTCLDSDKLKNTVAWATLASEHSPRDANPTAKRIAAIFLALALDCNGAVNRVLTLGHALDSIPDLDLNFTFDSTRGLAIAFARALSIAFDRAQTCALALDRALAFERARSLALDLANEYQKIGLFPVSSIDTVILNLERLEVQVSAEKISQAKIRKLNHEIIESFVVNLNMKMEFLSLSDLEIKQMINYFYILELMIRCKEAAVRVSPQVWAGIESRMVTVPTE